MIIPGFPRAAGGGRGPLFVAAAVGSTRRASAPANLAFNLALPASSGAGDLMIAFITAGGSHEKPVAEPPGWTTIAHEDTTGSSVAAWRLMYRYKQPGDTILPVSALTTLTLLASLQVWRRATLGSHSTRRGSDGVALQIASVTAGSAIALFAEMRVPVANNYSPTITGPASATEEAHVTAGGLGGCAQWTGIEQRLPAGPTGTRTFTDDTASPTKWWQMALVEIKGAN